MSKVAKQCIVILAVLLIGALGYAGFVSLQKQQVEQAKVGLEQQVTDLEKVQRDQLLEAKKLKDQAQAAEQKQNELQQQLDKFADVDVDALKKKVEGLAKEKDEWQQKVEAMKKEREDLMAKLQQKPEVKVVYKYVDTQGNEVDPNALTKNADGGVAAKPMALGLESEDLYWAQVLKEKTSLELDVGKLRDDLSKASVEVTEIKKKNSDLQLELTKLVNEKTDIERQIKYGKDLSDTLSLELARAQNDKKFLNDRLAKINEENTGLRDQIKQLTSTKIALEKSIVRLQDEKKEVEKKLVETENVIQGRIDEIWDIKKSLDESFGPDAKSKTQVELPPIVVSSQEMPDDKDPNAYEPPGINGNIVSVNSENNFVIIDIGEEAGINLGDNLNVYRGAEYVAGLEVIQVRKGIAAADIISKVSDIKVGDAVR